MVAYTSKHIHISLCIYQKKNTVLYHKNVQYGSLKL